MQERCKQLSDDGQRKFVCRSWVIVKCKRNGGEARRGEVKLEMMGIGGVAVALARYRSD